MLQVALTPFWRKGVYRFCMLCKFMTQETLIDLAPDDEHIAIRFGTVLQEICEKAAAVGTS
jgi:hypothetical protein